MTDRLKILLIGPGGHARSCIDVIEREGRFAVFGLIGREHEVGTDVLGYRVLGIDADLPALRRECSHALITVGQIGSAEARIMLARRLQEAGFDLPVIVSPMACVSPHAVIGVGTIVMHGAVVNAAARIGRHCIINSNALVEHDAVVEDYCHVSTAAILNGAVRVGAGSFVGSGAIVRETVVIGQRCTIGMGQSIRHDCPDDTRIPASGEHS